MIIVPRSSFTCRPQCLQVLTLLYGVYDNSPILSHTMHHLACNQDMQRTAQAEVDAVWGSRPPKTMEQLLSLRYVTACLKVGCAFSACYSPYQRCLRNPMPLHAQPVCASERHAYPLESIATRSCMHEPEMMSWVLGC